MLNHINVEWEITWHNLTHLVKLPKLFSFVNFKMNSIRMKK